MACLKEAIIACFTGPGLELNAVIQAGDDQTLLNEAAESVNTVNLMPEYLVVCCWRSIKECSLLLGQLTMNAPLIDPEGDPDLGLLSVKQVRSTHTKNSTWVAIGGWNYLGVFNLIIPATLEDFEEE